ncbi:GNAT family N-acetyltransferase [Escherichia coli]
MGENDYSLNDLHRAAVASGAFLTNHLKRQHEGKILRAYVLCTKEEMPEVLGYYTLSGSCFEKETLPPRSQERKVPYRNVPSITLGRLALDKSLQGQGLGSMLVTHAMRVVYNASLAVGIHGLFVEALNDKARAFYKSLGFIQLVGNNDRFSFQPTNCIVNLFMN